MGEMRSFISIPEKLNLETGRKCYTEATKICKRSIGADSMRLGETKGVCGSLGNLFNVHLGW